jgi:MscS family membrane protein
MNNSFFETVLKDFPWLWDVFAVVLLTLLANYIVRFIFRHLEVRLRKTKNLWDDALFDAAQKPASYLIWLFGFSVVLEILKGGSDAVVFNAIAPVREILVIVLLSWFLVRVVHQVELRLTSVKSRDDGSIVDDTTVLALGKLVRTAIIITSALVILQTMGYSISGVLAFGGIGGIAVGFAAKDLLANFFGGLMVYLDRPFAIGDWIRSPDKEIEGTVEYIGWRQTRIRTFDKRPLYIPNSTFMHISVENPSRMKNRRIYETIGIRYDDAAKMPAIINGVKSMLQNHPDIDTNQTLIVNFNSFAASSLDFFVYTFTKTTDWVMYHEIKQDVLLKILDVIVANDADVAFPTSTLKIPEAIEISSAGGPASD